MIDKIVFGTDLIIGAMYLPHEGSKYHSNEIFDNLNDDMLMINVNYNLPICLIGDSNSRTGLIDDFLYIDHHVAETTGLDISTEDFCDMKEILETKGICTRRFNSDHVVNNNGVNLIEFCKTFGLKIVNGRFGDDKGIGKFTCYNKNDGKSTVDYVIMSECLLHMIYDFDVDSFDSCMSDVHCPLNLTLKNEPSLKNKLSPVDKATEENTVNIDDNYTNETAMRCSSMKFNWDQEKAIHFSNSLNTVDFVDLKNDLITLEDNICQVTIDSFCEKLCNVFIDQAKNTGVCKEIKSKRTNTNSKQNNKKAGNKPWFDKDCTKRRSEYYKVKHNLKLLNPPDKQRQMKAEGKKYKQFINIKAKAYHKDFNKKLKKLKSSNPKEFWNILNKSTEGKQAASKVSIECFAEHFRKLGETDVSTEDNNFDPTNINHSINEELNKDFLVDEIKLLISKSKSNKACGIDHIRNEFLKNCPNDLIEIITLLFNIVLQSGVIPNDWCVGMIMPLFKNKGSSNNPDNYRGITLLSCIGKLFTAAINMRLTNYL